MSFISAQTAFHSAFVSVITLSPFTPGANTGHLPLVVPLHPTVTQQLPPVIVWELEGPGGEEPPGTSPPSALLVALLVTISAKAALLLSRAKAGTERGFRSAQLTVSTLTPAGLHVPTQLCEDKGFTPAAARPKDSQISWLPARYLIYLSQQTPGT